MFCPNCGNEVNDEEKVCPVCGYNLVGSESLGDQIGKMDFDFSKVMEKVNVRVIYFALAAVVLIMFFMGANSISSGGNEIMKIKSVGGKTLEEAYYLHLGSVYSGFATVFRGFGIFLSSVLVWLGLKK